MRMLTASSCFYLFLHALRDRHWKKKVTKKFKHGIIAPRIRASQRLHTAPGASIILGFTGWLTMVQVWSDGFSTVRGVAFGIGS